MRRRCSRWKWSCRPHPSGSRSPRPESRRGGPAPAASVRPAARARHAPRRGRGECSRRPRTARSSPRGRRRSGRCWDVPPALFHVKPRARFPRGQAVEEGEHPVDNCAQRATQDRWITPRAPDPASRVRRPGIPSTCHSTPLPPGCPACVSAPTTASRRLRRRGRGSPTYPRRIGPRNPDRRGGGRQHAGAEGEHFRGRTGQSCRGPEPRPRSRHGSTSPSWRSAPRSARPGAWTRPAAAPAAPPLVR